MITKISKKEIQMKNFNTLLASVTLAAAVATPAFAAPKTIQIGLDGLVCAFCAQGVEKKMKSQAATDKVFVSLEKKVAVVSLKDGQDIPDATIKAEITDAGYVVKSIARSEESFDTLTKKIKASK
jgi:mercuric ion binding protein